MIRFSALLPISAPFRISFPPPPLWLRFWCVFVHKPLFLYYIRVRVRINRGSSSFNCSQTNGNATLQKQWSYVHVTVHKLFKRMISSSNFVAIAWLVVLARKHMIQGQRVRFPVSLTCTLFSLRAFLRKVNIRKETSTIYRHVPNNGLLSASR